MSLIDFKILIYREEKKYFEINLKEDTEIKILSLLEKIKTNFIFDLKMNMNCRQAVCGSCAIKVNDKPILACKHSLSEFVINKNKGYTILKIEPLGKTETLGDLTTNMEKFYNSFKKIPEYLQLDLNAKQKKELYNNKIIDDCIKCGICYFICPVIEINKNFLSPSTINKNFKFLSDDRDTLKKDRLELSKSNSYQCIKCLKCLEFCPKSCDPFYKIEKTHTMLLNSKFKSSGTTHSFAIYNSIFKTGKIKESFVAIKTVGIIKSFKFMPQLFKIIFTGNFGFFKKSKNLREIKKLFFISGEKNEK